MAIDYKLINTNTTNYDGSRIYLKDDTTYDVGVRETLAIVVVGLYRTSKGDKKVDLDTYDPLTSSSFSAKITADGWYQFNMYSLPIYDSLLLSTYKEGDILYSTTLSSVVVITGVGLKKKAKIIDSIMLLVSSLLVASVETISVASNTRVMLKINSTISDLITNNVSFTDRRLIRLKDNYNVVRTIVQGSIYEYARGNKSVAQKNLEFLNTNDYTKI